MSVSEIGESIDNELLGIVFGMVIVGVDFFI